MQNFVTGAWLHMPWLGGIYGVRRAEHAGISSKGSEEHYPIGNFF